MAFKRVIHKDNGAAWEILFRGHVQTIPHPPLREIIILKGPMGLPWMFSPAEFAMKFDEPPDEQDCTG